MPRIDHAIVDVLVVDRGRYLLVQEGRPGREGRYNLPGGHVDAHETLLEAAVREVKEETGYEIELTGLVGIYQGIYTHINVSGPVFSARLAGGKARITQEHPEIRWVTRDELRDMARDGKLFTKFPPDAVEHYLHRGTVSLDVVVSYDLRH